jgi:predicted nucleic acid-binding protein
LIPWKALRCCFSSLGNRSNFKSFDIQRIVIKAIAQAASAALQSDVKAGFYRHAAVDWADVHQIGERLALQHTAKAGHRSFDILHIATALHFGATEFLTLDGHQKKLVEAEGLLVPV